MAVTTERCPPPLEASTIKLALEIADEATRVDIECKAQRCPSSFPQPVYDTLNLEECPADDDIEASARRDVERAVDYLDRRGLLLRPIKGFPQYVAFGEAPREARERVPAAVPLLPQAVRLHPLARVLALGRVLSVSKPTKERTMAFDLKSISRTRRIAAPKILLAGDSKIGKSTFAASAPNAIGICTEDGMAGIDGQAFPLCRTLDEVYSCIGVLMNEEHDFQTVFLDSLDWTEPLLHAHVCAQNKWDSIESPGYGKGYIAAAAEWKTLLDGFEQLRLQRSMGVILVSHVKQKRIESPTHEGYDAFVLKLHDRASALAEEWADIIGFAAHRITLKKTDAGFGQKETKAMKTGERMLYLEAHPAYPSGNRFGLTDCPLSWADFAAQLTPQAEPETQAA